MYGAKIKEQGPWPVLSPSGVCKGRMRADSHGRLSASENLSVWKMAILWCNCTHKTYEYIHNMNRRCCAHDCGKNTMNTTEKTLGQIEKAWSSVPEEYGNRSIVILLYKSIRRINEEFIQGRAVWVKKFEGQKTWKATKKSKDIARWRARDRNYSAKTNTWAWVQADGSDSVESKLETLGEGFGLMQKRVLYA